MDFLDPRKKRSRQFRLMIGYVLLSIAISMATLILVYMAYGYNIDRKSGQIVQTGLIFVSAQPEQADIFLNDKLKGKTDARFVVDAGTYTLKLQREGYRSWQRSFILEGNSIERFIYPFIFPADLKPQTIDSYPGLPTFVSQSPDRRYVLVNDPASTTKFSLQQYDTAKLGEPKTTLALPADLFSSSGPALGTVTEVEWSTDNKNVLVRRDFGPSSEYAVLNRDVPSRSFNVNKMFNVTPTGVSLRDKKADQLYILTGAEGSLRLGDTKDKTLGTPLAKNVLDFKPYGSNLLSYATTDGAANGMVDVRIWDNSKIYTLSTITPATKYLLNIARFQGDWFYVVGDDKQDRVEIYKNPLDDLKNNLKASRFFLLRTKNATTASFSTNARFVMAEADQTVAVYDFETQRSYRYNVSPLLSSKLHWMDGHRLIGLSGGNVVVLDFDNTNLQILSPSSLPDVAYFDRDYRRMLVFSAESGKQAFQAVELRTPADIPGNQKLKL